MSKDDASAPLTAADIKALIEAAGTTGGAGIGLAKGEKPVGVRTIGTSGPPGKEAPVNVSQYGTDYRAAPYQEGDQNKPGAGTQDQILNTQSQLVQAGLLSRNDVRPGFWDDKSASAYKVVLAFANAHAMKASDAMTQFLNNPQLQATSQRAPFQMTNPADITAAVSGGGPGQTNTARSLLGQDLSPADTAQFTDWYQNEEANARKKYMSADLSKTDAANSYTDKPSLDAAAQLYIKQHNLGQAVAYGTASRMLQFYQLLDGLSPTSALGGK